MSFLSADVSIQCDTAEYRNIQLIAWVAVILYPFGLLALNAALLFFARDAIRTGKKTELSRAISFLYAEYEPQAMWWECVEGGSNLHCDGCLHTCSPWC